MESKHLVLGEATGSPLQPVGHHIYGVGLIPLGDRNRAPFEENGFEERISIDKYTKYIPTNN